LGQGVEAQLYRDKGLEHLRHNDLDNAEAAFRKAVEADPDDPQCLSGLGSILGMKRKFQESTTYFERALRLDRGNIAARRNLASNQFQTGQLAEADKNLSMILKSQPGDPRTIVLLGMVKEGEKDYPAAIELLQSVTQFVRQQPELPLVLARAFYGSGNRERATEVLEALLRQPADDRRIFLAGQTAANAEDFTTAEKMFAAIEGTYSNPEILGYNLALVRYRSGRFAQSRQALLALVAKGYQSSDIYNLLARCYLKSQKLPEALDFANRAVQASPRSAGAYGLKGRIELDLHFYADAVQSYSRAVVLDSNVAETNLGLAQAQWGAGAISEAVAVFERGLKRFTRDASHYSEYARLLLELVELGQRDQKAEEQAVFLLETAISLDSQRPEPHYQMGNLLMTKGRTAEALKELQIAVSLNPEDRKIHYSLARVYRRMRRNEEAQSELRTYEKLALANTTP
jgi:tetratricopeptide (TPR) repeat protein